MSQQESARNNAPPALKLKPAATFFKRRRAPRSESAPSLRPTRLLNFSDNSAFPRRRDVSEPDLLRPTRKTARLRSRLCFDDNEQLDRATITTELDALTKSLTEERKAQFSATWNFDIDTGPQPGPYQWKLV